MRGMACFTHGRHLSFRNRMSAPARTAKAGPSGLRPRAAGYFRGSAPKQRLQASSRHEKSFPKEAPCREEATRTPDPYVPNVVRYQLRYFSKNKSAEVNRALLELRKLVDVQRDTALKVRSLILVDDTLLCKFVDHSINLGGLCLCCFLIGCGTNCADSVARSLCIIPVMQFPPFALAIGFFC